jgi:hypothetical protein
MVGKSEVQAARFHQVLLSAGQLVGARRASAKEFKALLSCLHPSEALTAEFPKILQQEWAKRTSDSTAALRVLKAQLREKFESQEKLVLAHLNNDKSIESVYERMSRKFEEEIATLEFEIAEAEMENASLRSCWSSRNLSWWTSPLLGREATLTKSKKFKMPCFPVA